VRKREGFRDGRPLTVTNEGLGLTSGRPPGRGPLEHLAFRGRGIRALAERAGQAGVEIVRGPEPSAYGLSLYLADPDGNVVEVFAEETG
jgi:catechol 2,3-dioxygenase-like lactoylglutathione lyase family enzyme